MEPATPALSRGATASGDPFTELRPGCPVPGCPCPARRGSGSGTAVCTEPLLSSEAVRDAASC